MGEPEGAAAVVPSSEVGAAGTAERLAAVAAPVEERVEMLMEELPIQRAIPGGREIVARAAAVVPSAVQGVTLLRLLAAQAVPHLLIRFWDLRFMSIRVAVAEQLLRAQAEPMEEVRAERVDLPAVTPRKTLLTAAAAAVVEATAEQIMAEEARMAA